MEQTSDIRSELVIEPSSHVSKEGMVDVQWPIPRLADLSLASQRDFLSYPRSPETIGMPGRVWKHLTGMSPLHTDSVHMSGDRPMTEKPNCN